MYSRQPRADASDSAPLDVVAAANADAESRSIYIRSLAEQIGIHDNRVAPQLVNFERAGRLTRLPKVGGERRVYYERIDSSFWEVCVDLAAEVAARVKSAE